MDKLTDLMQIYNEARAVPKEAQKPFSNGKFSGTDINPMWRIKKLTELFGPAGFGWYYEVLSERCEEHGDDDTIAVVDILLYVKIGDEWSKPIYGTGGNVIKRVNKYQKIDVSDEGYKMALTDALSVACKALGIGADIYFASDRTKYSAAQERETQDQAAAPREPARPPERREAPQKKARRDEEFTYSDEEAPGVLCFDCGKAIEKHGRFTAEQMARRTINAFGLPLCYECGIERQKKINAESAARQEE